MAVPIILAGAAIGSAVTGLVKLLDANGNNAKAKQMVTQALNCAEYVTRDSIRQNQRTSLSLDALGRLRLVCNAELMAAYVAAYKQVRNIDYSHPALEKFQMDFETFDIKPIETASVDASTFVKSGISTLTAGAAAGYGAYGLATYIGVASTGTAISSLSGVAATNATLAWLGGGALSAGGMGMAGGTTVLSGVIAGPALLVMGFLAAKQSEEFLTNAVQQEAEIRLGIEQIKNSIVVVKAIESRAQEVYETTHKLASIFIDKLIEVEEMLSVKQLALAAYKRREEERIARKKQAHTAFISKKISDIENDESDYKKNTNIFLRLWYWLTRKAPNFEEFKSEAYALVDVTPDIKEKLLDPLEYNNFTKGQQDLFQVFTMLGAALHGLLKIKLLDENGAINQEVGHVVSAANELVSKANDADANTATLLLVNSNP